MLTEISIFPTVYGIYTVAFSFDLWVWWGTSSSYTMPTRGVSLIHEAVINKPEGVAEGLLITAECIHDTPWVGMV